MRLILQGPRSVTFTDDADRAVGPRDVKLRTLMSGISHGTELNLYRGTAPTLTAKFDLDRRVYIPRPADEPTYPTSLGYELVAEIVEAGTDVDTVRTGDIVHIGLPHQEEVTINVDQAARLGYPLVRLPPDLSTERALFISLASVALVAVHDSAVKIGDTVAVFGLGAVGQLIVQLLKFAGAQSIIGVDPVAERREFARHSGANIVIDAMSEPRPGVQIKTSLTGGVDVSIETSASSNALHEAITAVSIGGRIVSVAYYQGAATSLRLGEEWHINRPEMVSSMGLWNCPHRNAPAWDRTRVTDTVVALLSRQSLSVDALLTHIFPFAEAEAAYDRLDSAPADMMRAAFRY